MTAMRDVTREDILAAVARSSLEWKLTDPYAFGLDRASFMQRAICRVADGRALGALALDSDIQAAFGTSSLGTLERPRELDILSGIRSGKSLFAACLAVHWSQMCDVSALRPGEVPRIPIVSLSRDTAQVVFDHLTGSLTRSPFLRELLIGDPTTDTVRVRHPTGRPIEITVSAGAKAGGSLVARWLAGVVFDEFTRMDGADDGAVINWDHQRQAVLFRMLPNAQIVSIGSPWAPFGPAYKRVQEHHGKPSARVVVVKAPGWIMNPTYWTPEKCAEAREADPDAFRTDAEAEFSTPDEALIPLVALETSTRKDHEQLPPERGCTYVAAMDPATRGNGWTLVVATKKGHRKVVVLAKEWRGSKQRPLDPGMVLDDIKMELMPYFPDVEDGIPIDTDQAMGDALIALARLRGLRLIQWTFGEQERTERYLALRTRLLMRDGGGQSDVELPPNEQLRADLLHIRKRLTQRGVNITLPETENGRHCDYAPSLMLALSRYLADERPAGQREEDPETVRMRELMKKRWSDRLGGRWT